MATQQWSGAPARGRSGKLLKNPLPDNTPLGEARRQLHQNVEAGWNCPCCQAFTKTYNRPINSGMARALISLFLAGGVEGVFTHGPSVTTCHETAQLSWWGLIQEEARVRPDGGRAGYWRVTRKGEEWIMGKITVEKYAKLYDGVVLGLHGDLTTIQESLGKKFNLTDLMNGV